MSSTIHSRLYCNASNDILLQLTLDRGVKAVIHLTSKGEEKVSEIAVPGIVSTAFIGEDSSGNIYLQTERIESQRVILEARQINAFGSPSGVVRILENDYASWTAKLLDVTSDGSIVQMLPQVGRTKVNVFSTGVK